MAGEVAVGGPKFCYGMSAAYGMDPSVMDLGTGQSQTISEASDDESPAFAPNGKLIVYASRAGGKEVLMTTTLGEIGELLRHRSCQTTLRYAKLDIDGLRTVARAWPTPGGDQ